MRKVTRRAAIAGSVAAVAGAAWWLRGRKPPLGMELDPGMLARARALLASHPAVDVHSHPGRFFLTGADPHSLLVRLMRDGFEAQRVADMRAANVTASLFAIVADLQVLGLADGGLQVVREFAPGEAYADYKRQLRRLESDIADGTMSLALTPEDVRAAQRDGRAAAILSCEGGDFIERDIGRVADAQAAGLRSITLVHYNPNALGDTQTSAAVHGGLSALGHDVVSEMNRLGMLIDVAHASYATCADVVAASSAPVMLSHSDLDTGTVSSPRFISAEHARLVTDRGGIVGAWPAGIGSESLADFVGQVLALVDAVGTEHVAIGSDMDGNYKPVLTEYADFPLLAAALLQRGLDDGAVVKILGENFLRVFGDAAA